MVFEPLTPERRRRQTRDYLLQAAARVFAARGFHGASLDEVAAVAGFTKGAVYSNFKSKDDLFLALLEARFEEQMEALHKALEAAEGAPEAHLSDFVRLVRDQWAAEGEPDALYQEFAVYAMRNPEARAKLAAFDRADTDAVAEILEAQWAQQGIETHQSPQHVARIVVALFRGLSGMRLIDVEAVDEPLLESVMTFFYRALVTASEPGRS